MKGRLITNGIMSAISSILLIVFIVLMVKAAKDLTYDGDSYYGTTSAVKTASVGVGIWVLMFFGWIASLIMGIVTLAMPKDPGAHGLTIASGVIAILGGVFFVGAIVSFIAASKVS